MRRGHPPPAPRPVTALLAAGPNANPFPGLPTVVPSPGPINDHTRPSPAHPPNGLPLPAPSRPAAGAPPDPKPTGRPSPDRYGERYVSPDGQTTFRKIVPGATLGPITPESGARHPASGES